MPRSVRRSLRRRDQDDDLPESWAAKHKQHKKQHDVFPDPERDAIDKRVRVETALHLFAKRYPNVARTNAAYAERYVMEACDICATLLPIRFCVVVNHFHNVFRSTKVAHNLTFDQYLNDIVKGHQCSGVQDLLRFPAARDLCHEADYEDDGLEQSLVPRKRRNRTRLFTPPQRDNTMSVLNRVFYDVLFDPLLALGPAIAHFGWQRDQWDALAGATQRGLRRLARCGRQERRVRRVQPHLQQFIPAEAGLHQARCLGAVVHARHQPVVGVEGQRHSGPPQGAYGMRRHRRRAGAGRRSRAASSRPSRAACWRCCSRGSRTSC